MATEEIKRVSYEELAGDLARIIDRVSRDHETIVVERAGEPVAVMTPVAPAGRLRRRGARRVARARPTTTFTVETAAGSVPALSDSLTWKEIEQRVKEERDERLIRKLSRE
jgi:prevent-host-death family protein